MNPITLIFAALAVIFLIANFTTEDAGTLFLILAVLSAIIAFATGRRKDAPRG